jgi:selenide,water dikinase
MSYNGRLTSLSHGGGCGCKIAPGILSDILKAAPIRHLPVALLAGCDNNEDAAVYQINDNQAIVATTDFFMPIVDDPYAFGRIAATNAISDIYAMGAQPLFALALLGVPINVLPLEVIQKITAGGESVCTDAGIMIAGGHSIDTVEPIYGLVAIGLVDPKKLKRNNGAKEGDSIEQTSWCWHFVCWP